MQRGQGNDRMRIMDDLKRPNWSTSTLKPFERAFYTESAAIKARPQVKINDKNYQRTFICYNIYQKI
jgi:hypothetical protein